MNHSSRSATLLLAGLALFAAILACSLSPPKFEPGSLEERLAEGNMKFTGSGNVSYIGCQDPTAVVSVFIGPKTTEIDGQKLSDSINLVTVHAITNGTQVKTDECQKVGLDEQYNWPAEGVYHPNEGKIVFTSCTQNNERAEGTAILVGEGFEGQYACYDQDGGLMYEVAISAYEIGQ